MKYDPHRSQERYLAWRHGDRQQFPDLAEESRIALIAYLDDLERGVNVARGSRKGRRSYIHILTTMYRLGLLARALRQHYGVQSLLEVTEANLHDLFGDMRTGRLPRKSGSGPYRSTGDYVKVFRAFWHWHMRVCRKRGLAVDDICVDLDARCEKPPWVYLTEGDVDRLCRHATLKYRVLMLFLFDSGVRSPDGAL